MDKNTTITVFMSVVQTKAQLSHLTNHYRIMSESDSKSIKN